MKVYTKNQLLIIDELVERLGQSRNLSCVNFSEVEKWACFELESHRWITTIKVHGGKIIHVKASDILLRNTTFKVWCQKRTNIKKLLVRIKAHKKNYFIK